MKGFRCFINKIFFSSLRQLKYFSVIVDNLCSTSTYYFIVIPEKQGCIGDALYIGGKTNGRLSSRLIKIFKVKF